MNIDIFIIARSASNRLPAKHMREINGKSIIENLVNRMKKSKKIRKIVVCTTKSPSDDKFSSTETLFLSINNTLTPCLSTKVFLERNFFLRIFEFLEITNKSSLLAYRKVNI